MRRNITLAMRRVVIGLALLSSSVAGASPSGFTFSGFIMALGLSVTGSLTYETNSVMPSFIGFSTNPGREGTTAPALIDLTFSNGDHVTASYDLLTLGPSFGRYTISASTGHNIVSNGGISFITAGSPALFSLSGWTFDSINFGPPSSLPSNFLSAGTPINYSTGPFVAGMGLGINGGGYSVFNVQVAAIPEPESWAMLCAGLGLIGFVARRRKQARV